LVETLNKAKKGDSKKAVKIEIKDEVFVNSTDSSSNVSNFNGVADIVPENEPCYILYKADPSQNKWIIVIWMPDGAKVRDRMIYASATDTIKKEFGYEYFLDDFQASTKEDFDDSALQAKIRPATSEDVMSESEKMLAEVRKEEEETRLEQQKLYDQRKGSKSSTAVLAESRDFEAHRNSGNEARSSFENARTSEKDEEEKDDKDEKDEKDDKDEKDEKDESPPPKVVVSPTKEPENIKVKSTPAAAKTTSMSNASTSPKSPENKVFSASKFSTPSKPTSTTTTTSSPVKVTTPTSSSISTANKPVSAGKLPASPFGSPIKGGGLYQDMSLPLDDKANSEVQRWKKGDVNWVELAIEKDKKDKIEFVSSKSIESRNLSSAVNASEARYYLFTYSGMGKKVNIFIYCCPDASQRQLRMVYATSKNSIPAAAAKLGINIEKKLEISTPSELTEDYIKSELSPKADAGRSSPSPHPKNVIKDSHPVYSLMTGGGAGGPAKKKIVMPPNGAYC